MPARNFKGQFSDWPTSVLLIAAIIVFLLAID
jgi:hypothetical protein